MTDRHQRVLRKYGLTEEQYDTLARETLGRCFLCGKPFSSARLECVDHDHRTGLVRGLLCTPCNWTLGTLHENAEWFTRAAQWIKDPPAVHVIGEHYIPDSIGADREQR